MEERERSTSKVDVSIDSSARNKSNVWIYTHRHPTADGWAIFDLYPSLPTPKRISTKGGARSTLWKHLAKVHKKVELQLARLDECPTEWMSAAHLDQLHQLLINAIVVDGRCFGDFRNAVFSRFFACAVPGESCFNTKSTSMHSLLRICPWEKTSVDENKYMKSSAASRLKRRRQTRHVRYFHWNCWEWKDR